MGYSGWNLFGAIAGVFNNQGINILLNLFFGPIVNAARAVSYQVSGIVSQFVLNFLSATRPQITKYYASNENDKMLKLVFQTSKFSFLLLFILSMPLFLEAEYIFKLWLNIVPDYVVVFFRLILLSLLIDSLSYPLMTAAQATGNVKKYQSIVGSIIILNLPISYIFLSLDFSPQTVFFIMIANSIVCLIIRLILLKEIVDLSILLFFRKVIIPICIVSFVSYSLPTYIYYNFEYGFNRIILIIFFGFISSITSTYFIGLENNERNYLLSAIKNKIL
jgi:O-antigen/teichoic acid export membrane protein